MNNQPEKFDPANDKSLHESDVDLRALFERTVPPDTPTRVEGLFAMAQQSPLRKSDAEKHSIRDSALPTKNRDISQSSFKWRAIMSLKIAAGILVLAGTVTLTSWLIPSSAGPSIAFADVQERLKQVHSVTYTESMTVPGKKEPEMSQRIMIFGSHLKRAERRDERADGLDTIEITDMKQGITLMLIPKLKQASINEFDVSTDAAKTFSFYERISKMAAEAGQQLPDREINGKQALVFYLEEKHGTRTFERTFCVDPKTRLPVRVEVKIRSTEKSMQPTDWVLEKFVFDGKLDKSLFDTTPPDDYTVDRKKQKGIRSK